MASEQQPSVGFIGLGIMGQPMVRNLLRAGYRVVVRDVVRPRSRRWSPRAPSAGARRATWRSGPTSSSRCSRIRPRWRPSTRELDGALEAARPGWLAIDMSSISPRVARELAARATEAGAAMLDAPVSGGDKGAIAGTLSIMVGGSAADFERALPVLQALGKTIVHVGPSGAGQVAKVCNQVVVAVVIEAVSEALVLGAKAGVDPARIADVLQGGLAATKVLEMRRDNILGGRFDPGFRIRLHLKDLKNALDLAREAGVVLPATAEVEQLMQRARIAGRGELDHSGLVTVLEDLAEVRVCDAAQRATDSAAG